MTPEKLKELAEFAAEFLKADKYAFLIVRSTFRPLRIPIEEQSLFEDTVTAPILAHLAKREMERLDFKWVIAEGLYSADYVWTFKKWEQGAIKTYRAEDKNEYIALWTAIQEAVGRK